MDDRTQYVVRIHTVKTTYRYFGRGDFTLIKVVKKDGTLEDFNVQKVVDAVNKSACRVMINFTEEEEKFICQFVEEKVYALGIEKVEIAQMRSERAHV